MKTLLIAYISVHHKNTEQVAKVMAEELGADRASIDQTRPETLTGYDLIGFGSGIFYGKFHRTLLQFVEGLHTVTGTRAFIFSTSGDGKVEHHAAFKAVSYTHLRAHETPEHLVCRLLLETKHNTK